LFERCEEKFPRSFPIGSAATEENVGEVVNRIIQFGYVAAIDYEDFNSQHSTQSMQEVMLAYFHVFIRKNEEAMKMFE